MSKNRCGMIHGMSSSTLRLQRSQHCLHDCSYAACCMPCAVCSALQRVTRVFRFNTIDRAPTNTGDEAHCHFQYTLARKKKTGWSVLFSCSTPTLTNLGLCHQPCNPLQRNGRDHAILKRVVGGIRDGVGVVARVNARLQTCIPRQCAVTTTGRATMVDFALQWASAVQCSGQGSVQCYASAQLSLMVHSHTSRTPVTGRGWVEERRSCR